MPFSSENGKPTIKWIVDRVDRETALDVGVGSGTYAKLFPAIKMDGIEIHEPYVEKYSLNDLYKTLYVEDVRSWKPEKKYDIVFLGDIIEHMTIGQAQDVIKKMRECAKTVIISIPIGYYPQEAYEGNEYERHVVDNYSVDLFVDRFGMPDYKIVDGEIGVFVYSEFNVRPRVCVYAIAKNESIFVDRFCDAAKSADEIFISDTGSFDDTYTLAKKRGATVNEICITPWRFDLARNAALALIPRFYDICVSLDLDEELQEGWREEIERVWIPGKTTRLRYMFDWGAGIAFKYEKIHARHGYRWHHPCHEYPVPDGRLTEVWADTDMLLVIHKPDPTKSRGQYLDLLKVSVEEDPYDPRNGFYYARELSFHARWKESISECNRYLSLNGANWPNERCYAYRVMGRCYNELGLPQEAERAFMKASVEAPNTREPWCELAMLYYRQSRWSECFTSAMRALAITNREMVYTVDPEVWGSQPHDLASIAAWHLGFKEISIEQAKLAVEKEPNNERLKANLRYVSEDPKTLNQEAA